ISQFDIENKDLIDEVESEKIKIDINKRIAKAYNEFVKKLNIYRNSLPSLLIADLAEKVKTLYNGFNRLDKNGDLLADVRLPLESGSKIEIAFNSNPSQMYDALHVLSEGHIRCLGLSILLAKNINQKCPLLVFDDPVNAIDDDHREGIRKTIFSEGLFIDTQIILTCHGEEFLKDISNILGVDKFCKTKTFTFIPHTGDNQLIIDYQTTPRNYIVAATEKFSRREIRESLTNCRRAMEFISNELWRLISRRMDGTIKLKFKDPKSKTELRNKIEQLKSKVTNNEFTHPKKDELLSAFTNILGIDGQSKEWRYLNDATHENEDCEEFDISTVKIIIDSLDVFDDLINHH
ncbi:MAG: chromosome segregation protein SMC, partial [bacterium]